MEIKKQIIDEIFKCYSVNALTIDGRTQLLFAGEGPGICKIYSGENFEECTTLWEGGGGTMSLVTVPDTQGYFFASKGFYSMVDSESSAIYLIRYIDGKFIEEKVVDVPYLHRFEVITVDKKRYLIAAALHSGKKDKEDWSKPGKLYVGEIPYNLDEKMNVEVMVIKDNVSKNHGFNRGKWKDKEAVFVASEEGVMAVMPPQDQTGDWEIEDVFNHPISDVAAIDLDGDGELEFALLSPFHGNQFDVFKKVDGEYKSVFKYHKPLDFYHAIYADTLNGVPSFVIGARKEDMDLFVVQYDKKEKVIKSTLLEAGAGSSNARIIHTENGDIILSANRQINQAAIYKV